MSASFTAIKAPPQTLERLDTWGTLDDLPWSLDNEVWTTAGEYTLTALEQGRSGGSASFVRKKNIALTGAATCSERIVLEGVALLAGIGRGLSGELFEGEIFRPVYDTLSGSCSGAGKISALRIRNDTASASGVGGELVAVLRIRGEAFAGDGISGEGISQVRARLLEMNGAAHGSQSEIFLRVFPLLVTEPARSGERFVLYRVRTDSPEGEGGTGERFHLRRIRTGIMPGWGQSAEALAPEYKGWTWKQEPGSAESVWTQQTAEPEAWRQIPGTDNEWRSVVQWQ